jgi:type III restriction enzyme
VYDSRWEANAAYELDRSPHVLAWAKNDHLGFEILYLWKGVVAKYRPDYLVRMKDGTNLVVEVKGRDAEREQAKRRFLDKWAWDVALEPADVPEVLERHGRTEAS